MSPRHVVTGANAEDGYLKRDKKKRKKKKNGRNNFLRHLYLRRVRRVRESCTKPSGITTRMLWSLRLEAAKL